ncbi:uncharacterized protein LOC144106440 isoform X2 [Amblyomma americanum]
MQAAPGASLALKNPAALEMARFLVAALIFAMVASGGLHCCADPAAGEGGRWITDAVKKGVGLLNRAAQTAGKVAGVANDAQRCLENEERGGIAGAVKKGMGLLGQAAETAGKFAGAASSARKLVTYK